MSSTSTTIMVNSHLERFRNGDQSAKERMIAVAQRRLEALAHRALQKFPLVRRFNETGDIVQSASVRLWKAMSTCMPNDARHFFALASQHIRWELLSLQEKLEEDGPLGRNHATAAFAAETNAPSPVDNAGTTDPLVAWTNQKTVIECIGKLPEQLREVVDLYIVQDLARGEVANLIGVSERQINRLWIAARLELVKLLGAA